MSAIDNFRHSQSATHVNSTDESVGDSPRVERSLGRSFLDNPAHLEKGHETPFGVVGPVRVFLIKGNASLVGGLDELFYAIVGGDDISERYKNRDIRAGFSPIMKALSL